MISDEQRNQLDEIMYQIVVAKKGLAGDCWFKYIPPANTDAPDSYDWQCLFCNKEFSYDAWSEQIPSKPYADMDEHAILHLKQLNLLPFL